MSSVRSAGHRPGSRPEEEIGYHSRDRSEVVRKHLQANTIFITDNETRPRIDKACRQKNYNVVKTVDMGIDRDELRRTLDHGDEEDLERKQSLSGEIRIFVWRSFPGGSATFSSTDAWCSWTVQHSQDCPHGGLSAWRHGAVRRSYHVLWDF